MSNTMSENTEKTVRGTVDGEEIVLGDRDWFSDPEDAVLCWAWDNGPDYDFPVDVSVDWDGEQIAFTVHCCMEPTYTAVQQA